MTRVKRFEILDLRFLNSEAGFNSRENTRTTTDYFNFSNDFGAQKRVNHLKINSGLFLAKVGQIRRARKEFCKNIFHADGLDLRRESAIYNAHRKHEIHRSTHVTLACHHPEGNMSGAM